MKILIPAIFLFERGKMAGIQRGRTNNRFNFKDIYLKINYGVFIIVDELLYTVEAKYCRDKIRGTLVYAFRNGRSGI
jgi:hypothetical protein